MKKLTLKLDDLEIETFEPETSAAEQLGSVAAHVESALLRDCPTYDRRNVHCYLSIPYEPGGVCTPVCGTFTEDLENC